MSEITRLEPKPKNPDRLNLHLDGKYYCSIDALVAAKHTLYVGKEIDGAALDKIIWESGSPTASARSTRRSTICRAIRPPSKE